MGTEAILHEAERIALHCVPELRCVYVIDGAALPDSLMLGDGGCFYPGLDEAFRPQLEYVGRWKGPGTAVVVNTRGIRDAYTVAGLPGADDAIVATALHEVCHAVGSRLTASANPLASFTLASANTAAIRATEPVKLASSLLASHGRDFHRLAVHCWSRAYSAGCRFSLALMGIGNAYPAAGFERLSSPAVYFVALAEECQRLRSRSLADVLNVEPPVPFVQLWKSECDNRTTGIDAASPEV